MNITELARNLKITPQELRDNLPQLGFDIGQRAIKINRSIANKIIKDWPRLKRQIEYAREKELEKEKKEKEEVKIVQTIRIPQYITVKEFAQIANLPINSVLAELMKNGIFASLNEKIDFETAWLIGEDLGLKIKLAQEENIEELSIRDDKLEKALEQEKSGDLTARPPVIVVMGHVDHGKTKLLDAIRQTNVVDGEAGGITQHIGAYQVTRRKKLITFIDTPGHEAFTAMRSRGAKIADIAILVVAADDGVKPQTVEAFRIIEAAKIPYVVAINKIDKEGANIDKVKQELSNQLKIIPEDWGGKIICAGVSALKNTGVVELLDMVLLLADTEADNIKVNPDAPAIGTIIESHIDKGAGPIATLLIQNGTLRIGDNLTFNNNNIGKVRSLKNYRAENIDSALPATPVQIIGLKLMPQVGDMLEVGLGERTKFKKTKTLNQSFTQINEESQNEDQDKDIKKINVIIKSDVLGSAEAIEESLIKLNNDEVNIVIIHKGLGNVSDGDIKRAEATGAIILGFNTKLPMTMEEVAREKNIIIREYSIIYDLINDIKQDMDQIAEPKIEQKQIGKLEVKAIFRTDKKDQIVGGKVMEGSIEPSTMARVIRQKQFITEGKITRLQSGKEDITQAQKGEECGLQYSGDSVIKEGDILEVIKEERIFKKK